MRDDAAEGWRAQQKARGLQESTIVPRERLVRGFLAFTNKYPWHWAPSWPGPHRPHADQHYLSRIRRRRRSPVKRRLHRP